MATLVKQYFTQNYYRFLIRKTSWQALCGLALLFLAGLFYCAWILPKQTHLAELTMRATRNQAAIQPVLLKQHTDLTQVFYYSLPVASESHRDVAAILQLSEQNQLAVSKVQYRLQASPSKALRYLQVKMPVQGSYMQIRQFITQALNSLPSVSLDEVSFQREDLASDVLSAQLQFTLYTQNDHPNNQSSKAPF